MVRRLRCADGTVGVRTVRRLRGRYGGCADGADGIVNADGTVVAGRGGRAVRFATLEVDVLT